MTSSATTLIPAVDELDSHQEWRVVDAWVEILRRFCHDRSKSVLPKKPGFIFNRVIVVEARTNHVAYLRPFVPNLLAIVESARRSTASIVRPLKNKPSRNSSTNIPAHQLPAFTTTGAQYLTARSASDELPTYAADPAPLSEIGRGLSPLGQAGISRRPCYSFKFFGGTVTHNVRGVTLASVFTAQ